MSLKTIYFIRHAESTHNAYANNWPQSSPMPDPFLFDADLSPEGISQSQTLLSQTESIPPPELIVVSPLRRALSTMELGLKHWIESGVEVLVHPLAIELLDTACDVGTPRTELVKIYPHYDFGLIEEELFW